MDAASGELLDVVLQLLVRPLANIKLLSHQKVVARNTLRLGVFVNINIDHVGKERARDLGEDGATHLGENVDGIGGGHVRVHLLEHLDHRLGTRKDLIRESRITKRGRKKGTFMVGRSLALGCQHFLMTLAKSGGQSVEMSGREPVMTTSGISKSNIEATRKRGEGGSGRGGTEGLNVGKGNEAMVNLPKNNGVAINVAFLIVLFALEHLWGHV